MNEIEVAWAAGLFEGEGTFVASRQKSKPGWVGLLAALRSTDRDVIERFAAAVGTGRLNGPHLPPSNGIGKKPYFEWKASASEAKSVADLLLPHLMKRRCEQIASVLDQRRQYEESCNHPLVGFQRPRKERIAS